MKIDKGLAVPPPMGQKRKYPWPDMRVGDSFFIPEVGPSGEDRRRTYRRMASSLVGYRSFTLMNFRIATRRRTENGVEGMRVWRIL